MSQTSTNPALKWILIVIAVMTAIGAVAVVLLAYYPAGEYRAAKELQARGFIVEHVSPDDNWNWKYSTYVLGDGQSITSDDSRFICQLSRLHHLEFVRCDMSGLNLDEIGNCRELDFLAVSGATQFPVSELKKLTACPIRAISVVSKDVPLNDSDLEEFTKFTNLVTISLKFNNAGITDACLEYFEKIPTLKYLILKESSLTQEGIEEFTKKRPDVEVYYE